MYKNKNFVCIDLSECNVCDESCSQYSKCGYCDNMCNSNGECDDCGTDLQFGKHDLEVMNGEGYYDEDGFYHAYAKEC